MTQRYDLTGPATITLWATYTYILMQVVYSGWLLWYNKTYSAYLANESVLQSWQR